MQVYIIAVFYVKFIYAAIFSEILKYLEYRLERYIIYTRISERPCLRISSADLIPKINFEN